MAKSIYDTIKVFDNGGETFDRYTVIIDKDVYTMSANPNSPQGVNLYCGSQIDVDYLEQTNTEIPTHEAPLGIKKAILRRIRSV